MADFATYVNTGRMPPVDQASDKHDPDAIYSVQWVICWHPDNYLCVTAEAFRASLISEVQKAVRAKEGPGAKSASYIDRLCVGAEIDAKNRLRIPQILVTKAQIEDRVMFTRQTWLVELWPLERFEGLFAIPSIPERSQPSPTGERVRPSGPQSRA